MANINTAKWLERDILDPDHQHQLERAAAIHEFGPNKLPRQDAEERAYQEYMAERRRDACAHHFQGMKAAQAVGNMEAARQHGALYDLHMKALGYDTMAAPPPEIASRTKNEANPNIYKFKAHKGDYFALPKESGEEKPAESVVKSEEPLDKSEESKSKSCSRCHGKKKISRYSYRYKGIHHTKGKRKMVIIAIRCPRCKGKGKED